MAPLALLFALLTPTARAGEELPVPPEVRAAPAPSRFPDDDVLWIRRAITWTLAPDGRLDRQEERTLRVQAPHADRTGLLDPLLTWNAARARLDIEPVVTWMRDGTPVRAQANSFVPNTPPALEPAPAYAAAIQATTVAFVGVERGASTRLAFAVRDRAASGVPAWGAVDLAGPHTILDQAVRVDVPAGTPLTWAVLDGTAEPALVERDGRRVLALDRREVPGLDTSEPHAGHDGVERLLWSTAPDWASVVRFLSDRAESAVVVDDAIRAAATRAAAGTLSREERVARLHALVTDGVLTVDWPFADLDYAARPAPEILGSSTGHGLDKAVLLTALLRSVGEEATPALAAAAPEVAPDVPCPLPFDRAWVRVGPDLWLDPTASPDVRGPAALAGQWVLLLDGRAQAPMRMAPLDPASNRAALALDVTLVEAPGGLSVAATADLDLAGRYNPAVGFDRGRDRLAQVAGGLSPALGGAKAGTVVAGTRRAEGSSLRVPYAGGLVDRPASGAVRLEIPRVPGAVTLASVQGWRERRTLPVPLPAPGREEVRATWTLPPGWIVLRAPPAVEIRNRAGTFRRTVERDGGTITVRADLDLTLAVVEPADWPDLRALLVAAEAGHALDLLIAEETP